MTFRVTRRGALAYASTAWVSLILTGCGATGIRPGLYIAGADGAPRWIDDTTGPPAWSPGGAEIAWGDEHGLKMWDAESGRVATLTDTPMVGRPAWSPDGSALAFLDRQARALQSLNVSSQVTAPLAVLYDGHDGVIRPPVVTRGGPAWSPDGERLAFICWDERGDEICVVDADGNARQQITSLGGSAADSESTARSSATSVVWSPDGEALAVSVQAEQSGATSGIFRIELARRSGKRLTTMTANSPLVWEAATDDLLYSARVEGRNDVYRLPAAGGRPSAITTELVDGAHDPAIATSGDMAVVSGSQIVVLSAGSVEATVRDVAGMACASPALSPDAEQLAFLALPRPIAGYP